MWQRLWFKSPVYAKPLFIINAVAAFLYLIRNVMPSTRPLTFHKGIKDEDIVFSDLLILNRPSRSG
jgi:hypothetical protein